MAQVQLPSLAEIDKQQRHGPEPHTTEQQHGPRQEQQQQQQQQQRHLQQHYNDDSWARPPPGSPRALDGVKHSVMDLEVTMPAAHTRRRSAQDFSIEDLEVARALTGLRQASPPEKISISSTLSTYHPPTSSPPHQPEPLLSLLTSQHPAISNAINTSLSAYNVGKTYSRPFRYGAEFVERNIASPVANTVGTAGRLSGVEHGVRWWLERSNKSNGDSSDVTPSAASPNSSGNKRRRDEMDFDIESGLPSQRSRAASDISMSMGEYLPAYDSNRSPSYSSRDPHPRADDEEGGQHQQQPQQLEQHDANAQPMQVGNSTWQHRLIVSTSGLGVAMSHESRRSLKYCLSWLRWANGRLGRLLFSLQSLLAEYEVSQHRHQQLQQQKQDPKSQKGQPADGMVGLRDPETISAQLGALKAECIRTLQDAMDVVSRYAGGALPENARALVRRHLTSLPQRFAFMASLQEKEEKEVARRSVARQQQQQQRLEAEGNENGDAESAARNCASGSVDDDKGADRETVVLGARRVVVLAREGLDMMSQVSAVVDSTITSAEEWCDRLGRKQPVAEQDEEHAGVTKLDHYHSQQRQEHQEQQQQEQQRNLHSNHAEPISARESKDGSPRANGGSPSKQ